MRGERKNVAILFGGRSVEHEISVISALQLIEALDSSRYSAVPVYITQDGKWYSGEPLTDKDFYRSLPDSLSLAGGIRKVALLPVPGVGGLTLLEDRGWFKRNEAKIIPIDVYFPVFHGTYGEDGCVQGLLELADVAYAGSGVLGSAVGMDKFVAKRLAQTQGVPVLPDCLVSRRDLDKGLASIRRRISEAMDFPVFVKPRSLGSSVAIGRADDERQLDAALIQVFEVDQFALVEPCIAAPLEINVAVLAGERARTSVVEIPIVEGGGILGYDEKYMRQGGSKGSSLSAGTAGTARVIDPVDLPSSLKEKVGEYAISIFTAMLCAGVARVDFICDPKADRLYFNEINTLPGSLAYYLWAQSEPPILYTELLSILIEQAEIDRERSKEVRRNFGFRSLLS